MNQIKKILISVMVVLTIGVCFTLPTFAAETVSGSKTLSQSEIRPLADVIVRKYRVTAAGVTQYRRWNETQECWVDPYWINL